MPLVQELGQQIHLFLAEYNRYNSDSTLHGKSQNNVNPSDTIESFNEADSIRQINLPGFRRRSKNTRYGIEFNIPFQLKTVFLSINTCSLSSLLNVLFKTC